ncbi:MAG TPA: A/G-specific adenine glycosylase [Bryobacteraceae bacterium]
MIRPVSFRRALLAWYDRMKRDLPWRTATPDFYRVWLSEIMLQQTRVEAVIPYFHRFLDRFPDVHSLALAPEPAVLAAWSGLGYYSRARNLHQCAKQVAAASAPAGYEDLRALAGIGPYTAAAIASIAFGQPHAAVDGNVMRVISRVTGDAGEISSPITKARFTEAAQLLLDPARPGDFNQAMMELGATVCIPRAPRCGECPVARFCQARASGRETELPVKLKKNAARDVPLDLAIFRNGSELFLIQRAAGERRLAGFWELPGKNLFPRWRGRLAAQFTHQIVNDRFRISVFEGPAPKVLPNGKWFVPAELDAIPLTTVTRKALRVQGRTKVPSQIAG